MPTPVVGERLEVVFRIPLGDGHLKQGFILQSQLTVTSCWGAGGAERPILSYPAPSSQCVAVSYLLTVINKREEIPDLTTTWL